MCAKGHYMLRAPTGHTEELDGLRRNHLVARWHLYFKSG
jgi:hypothetical protein